ncbi:hypothetical protein IPA_00535 [Ignicoccus pacificus DSM 13166]|uniref:Uncharacterized protein n=1 Tax=Ignicoccus pacificus DSM 13166 TaxID=940294 RepID=A0A977KBE3_9CREN|nr:hypothetical protein IPA_00535 [Ignicoccus pacificus DSM 13166]
MSVKLGKLKALLLPADVMIVIYDKISKRADEVTAALVLYEVGKEMGARIARNAFEKVMEPKEAFSKIPELLRWIGLEGIVKDSKVYMPSALGIATEDEEGVCHFERGLIAGFMSGLTRAPWEAVAEIGDEGCVIKPRVGGVKIEEVEELDERVRSRLQG